MAAVGVSLELHAGACGPHSTRRKLARFSGGTLASRRLTRALVDVRVAPPLVWTTTCLAGS
jgi:hypothetical protein